VLEPFTVPGPLSASHVIVHRTMSLLGSGANSRVTYTHPHDIYTPL
jgi:hypothetical protein